MNSKNLNLFIEGASPVLFHPGECVQFHPGEMTENSPTLQLWVGDRNRLVPEGRQKLNAHSVVPPGLFSFERADPNVKTLGYSRASLRDKDGLPIQSHPRGMTENSPT